MTIGLVLLSSDDCYVGAKGQLPTRPSWDKEFLLWKVSGKKVLCSANTLKDLPPSVRNAALYITTDPTEDWEVNLGIDTFTHLPDEFYITRGGKAFLSSGAKKLRLDFLIHYKRVVNTPELQIYVKRT